MTAPGEPLRIVVIDPHEITRDGIVAALADKTRFDVLGAVDTIRQMYRSGYRPDLVVTELFEVADDGDQLEEMIRTFPTVIFTVATAPLYRIQCWLVRARAVLSKSLGADALRNAINESQRTSELVDRPLAEAIFDVQSAREGLTPELEKFIELSIASRPPLEIEKEMGSDYGDMVAKLRMLCERSVGPRLVFDNKKLPFARPTIGPEEPILDLKPAPSPDKEIFDGKRYFSPAEKLVLEYLARGYSLGEIAAKKMQDKGRGGSKLTVKKQLESALGKVYHRKQQGTDGKEIKGHEFTVEFGQLFALHYMGELANPDQFERLKRYQKLPDREGQQAGPVVDPRPPSDAE